MLRRVLDILRYDDPRAGMIWSAWAASLFGSFVLADSLVRLVRERTATETGLYAVFDLLPGWVLGGAFAAAAWVLVYGVVRESREMIQRAALVLLFGWVYVWFALPVASAFDGAFLATAFARYTSPIPLAWWVYTRASYPDGFLGPGVVARPKPGASAIASLVVAPAAGLALVQSALAQAAGSGGDALSPAVWGAIAVVVTGLLTYLGQRFAKRSDMSTAWASETWEHNRWLVGTILAEREQVKTQLVELEQRFNEAMERQETRDRFCRANCPAFPDRP
ncbi:MAG: hypothetical protein CMM84_03695 [Rhodothermaceae bacterium]|nr:hypothetical protein [Rhodothermaceae bacterium]MBC15320.1 hypothetical protein [Rhodothermaceae bacterium]